jgi:hypothetical protein
MKKRTYDHTRNFGDIGVRNAYKMPGGPQGPTSQESMSLSTNLGASQPPTTSEEKNAETNKKHFYLEYDFKPTRNDQVIDVTAVRNIVTRTTGVDTWIQRGNIWEFMPPIGKELIVTRINFFVLKSNWTVDPRPYVGPGHDNGFGVFAHDPEQFGHIMANPLEYFNMINFDVLINGVPPVSFIRKVRYEDATGVITDNDQQGPSTLSMDVINDGEPRPGSFFLRIPQQAQFVTSFYNRHNGGLNEYGSYQSPRSVGVKLRGFLRNITSDIRRDRDKGM